MANDVDIAETAALFGDRVRAEILIALLDQTSMSAGQLAFVANVSPQTASFHLQKLTAASLVRRERNGRNASYSLAGASVASAIEALAALSPSRKAIHRSANGAFSQGRQPAMAGKLRAARTCYDHLAGQAGVMLHDSLIRAGYLVRAGAKKYKLTSAGDRWLETIPNYRAGVKTRAVFARPCLDWSEGRAHLAGILGSRLLDMFFEERWIVRMRNTRAVRITELGLSEFQKQFGIALRVNSQS